MPHIFTQGEANIINWSIVAGGTASGLFNANPKLWYENFVFLFVFISVSMNLMGGVLHVLGMLFGKRCQPDAPKQPKFIQETIGTLSSYYVAAFLMAWPYTDYCTGKLTAYVWSMEESYFGTSILWNALFVVGFLVFIDFWSYWKHYLLHTPTLWIFHEPHHRFANPSVQAVFAVTPVESFWTFSLVLVDCLPIANDYKLCIQFHGTIIFLFSLLNLYLHCGYTFDAVEWLLQRLMINSSSHHNFHHLKVRVNYSELLTFWDLFRGTGETPYNSAKFRK